MDCITIKGLTFRACHGVLPHEREFAQTFTVDAELFCDLVSAASDALSDTVDYGAAADYIESVVCGEPRALLEKLALLICEGLIARFTLRGARVTVKKPEAPLSHRFSYVAATVEIGVVR